MLIANAQVYGLGVADVRVLGDRISAIGRLSPSAHEKTINAQGGALLPGLNDHHIHLMALAAGASSVRCGPPDVVDQPQLVAALRRAQQAVPRGWLRGIGYHESVAGDIDREWLDQQIASRPVRIQHRSGRLWMVNSPGLDAIEQALAQLPRAQRPVLGTDGRLFDLDGVLRLLPDARLPPVHQASRTLARYGVTGFTDMTPSNDARMARTFASLQQEGHLLQRVCLAGAADLSDVTWPSADLIMGPTKIHLHETQLPDFEALCASIQASHQRDRAVAIHCVTEVELVYALAAWREVGVRRDRDSADRVEHASLTPPALLEQIRDLGLTVVTQPHFVCERGDAYVRDIPPAQRAWLYRCASFRRQLTPLAGGSDAPFGHPDPWRAMAAAVTRRTSSGRLLGADEALTPEQALSLFLGALDDPAHARQIGVGQVADLCLLDCPWSQARNGLSSRHVRATLRDGRLIHDGVDQAPLQGELRPDGLS